MSYTHDHSALRDEVAVQRAADYTNTWPDELRDAFWSAVNAPTHGQSAEKTLAFATMLAHELAEQLRGANTNWEDDVTSVAWDSAADFIDPEVTS